MSKNGVKFNIKITVLFIFVFHASLLSAYSAENFFVTQSGAGQRNGLSVENAFSVYDFNNISNWGLGTGKISGGDIVFLRGTIISDLNLQGSGFADNPIVIDGAGSTLSGRFIGYSKNYFTLKNLTWSSGMTASHFFDLRMSTNISISNITIPSPNTDWFMLWRGVSYLTANDVTITNTSKSVLDAGREGSTISHHLTFSNWYITTTNDYVPAIARDIISTQCAHDVTLEKSYINKRWSSQRDQDSGGAAHNDIWQAWGLYADASCPNPYNFTARYNTLITDVNYDGNYQFIIWGAGSGDNIYGNIFLKKGSDMGGSFITLKLSQGNTNIFNNTFVQKDTPAYFQLLLTQALPGVIVNFKNNIVYNSATSGGVIAIQSGSGSIVHEYNTYFRGTTSGYLGTSCKNYASSSEICDSDPFFADYENNEFSLRPDSKAKGIGISLGPQYQQQLKPWTTWPRPDLVTPPTMNIGAYGTLTLKQPLSPTLLSIK